MDQKESFADRMTRKLQEAGQAAKTAKDKHWSSTDLPKSPTPAGAPQPSAPIMARAKKWVQEASDNVEDARHLRSHVEMPREHPRGIFPERMTPERAVFRVKAARRKWRWVPPILALFGYPAAIYFGFALGWSGSPWEGMRFSWGPMFIFLGSLTALLVVMVLSLWPKLKFTVTPNHIEVAGRLYDRTHFGGMRVGYEIESKEGVSLDWKNSFVGDNSLGFSGIRLKYGRWGEDLDYMVNRYHAHEYMVWMNEVIASVGAPAPKEHDPAMGRRKIEF